LNGGETGIGFEPFYQILHNALKAAKAWYSTRGSVVLCAVL